jgi:8-oxo-dGTP diphosphatase
VSVLLIRHAHAGKRSDWSGDDVTRPLSSRGQRQAKALVDILGNWAPQRLLSSPYRRCQDTVAPMARAFGLRIEGVHALAEGGGTAVVALVRSVAADKVALCTHGDVIPEVLIALADEDGLDLGARPAQAKGSVWILEGSRGRFVNATYLTPGA